MFVQGDSEISIGNAFSTTAVSKFKTLDVKKNKHYLHCEVNVLNVKRILTETGAHV